VATTANSSASSQKKSAKQQLEFERAAREKLENADMNAFDRLMKRITLPNKSAGSDSGSR
jgi:hypothetical protein